MPAGSASSPASAASTAASSAGVARQNSSGRHPSTAPASPASRAALWLNTALQYLGEQHPQHRRRSREPQLDDRGADPLARARFRPLVHAVPEQRRDFTQLQPPLHRPLGQREQRPQLADHVAGERVAGFADTRSLLPAALTDVGQLDRDAIATISMSAIEAFINRPLVVAINTWAGHAPGIVFNGGMEPGPASEYKRRFNLDVKFVLLEDPAAKLAASAKRSSSPRTSITISDRM